MARREYWSDCFAIDCHFQQDGFVSVDSPTLFYDDDDGNGMAGGRQLYPSLTTTPVRVPRCDGLRATTPETDGEQAQAAVASDGSHQGGEEGQAPDVYVVVNAVTSVVGWVAVELLQRQGGSGSEGPNSGSSDTRRGDRESADWAVVAGHDLDSADLLRGNFIRARSSWANGTLAAVPRGLVGEEVAFRVSLADASVYSITFSCA